MNIFELQQLSKNLTNKAEKAKQLIQIDSLLQRKVQFVSTVSSCDKTTIGISTYLNSYDYHALHVVALDVIKSQIPQLNLLINAKMMELKQELENDLTKEN